MARQKAEPVAKEKRDNIDPAYYRRWHLAKSPEELKITEFEYGVIRFHEAFARCAQSMLSISAGLELGFPEQTILHVIRMQNRPKGAATIARLVNRDDIPNIQYSLRKLEAMKLIRKIREKGVKSYNYTVTSLGEHVTNEYSKVRTQLLTKHLAAIADIEERIGDAGELLSLLTGIYEEVARISATYNQKGEDGGL